MSRKRQIRPSELRDYFLANAWTFKSKQVHQGSQFLIHNDHPGIHLRVPVDPTYSGAESVVDMTLMRYVECSGQAEDELRTRIAHVHNDVMQVRVFGALAARDLPLNYSTTVSTALRKLLRAGFQSATRHRAIDDVGNVDEIIARRLNATFEVEHHNGFVDYRIACPLGLSRAEMAAQDPDIPVPVGRRVMHSIEYRLAELNGVIADGIGREFLEEVERQGWYNTSSTFAEAALDLFDKALENDLEIRFLGSPCYSGESLSSDRVLHFRHLDVSLVQRVYQALLDRESPQTYVGTLDRLEPDIAHGPVNTGKAVLTVLAPDGKALTVQFDMNAAHYTATVQALKEGFCFLRVKGLLRLQHEGASLARIALRDVSELAFLVDGRVAEKSTDIHCDA